MQLVEWAFKQDLPHSEKLVLLWLASRANSVGFGLMDRELLSRQTGYATRSVQRLLRDLRKKELLSDGIAPWYRTGPYNDNLAGLESALPKDPSPLHLQLAELPEEMRPLPPGEERDYSMTVFTPPVDADGIAQTVGDYVIDQLNTLELRFNQRLDAMVVQQNAAIEKLHTANYVAALAAEPEPPPPDPVKENPLYAQLLGLGMSEGEAYELSEKDLLMEAAEQPEENPPPVTSPEGGEYANDAEGRLTRILDILHGADSQAHYSDSLVKSWRMIEELENKHTVKGETDAFLLLYPAIVDAAKAHVGKTSAADFVSVAAYKAGAALWDQELDAEDKEDPQLNIEIAQMLAELEKRNDPRCVVQPRTKETGDDGVVRTETLKGFYLRVKAKYDQMIELAEMGVFDVG